jgi:hypothetical protein
MTKGPLRSIIWLILLLISILSINCSDFLTIRKLPSFKSAIAISVRELTRQYASGQSGDSLTLSMNSFCGINRILGYVLDVKNRDVIVIGARVEPAPDLLLDDFVVTLRNEVAGGESPGCSIDPKPQEMDSLHSVMKKLQKWTDPFIQGRILSKWRKIPAYENTRVLGVEKNCNMADVMLKADYLMKKTTNGTHRLRVRGFESFMDMTLDDHMRRLTRNQQVPQEEILERFWFCPTKSVFLSSGNTIYFRQCSVKLLTEEMYWSEQKAECGTGHTDSVAEKFVELFSRKYRDISEVEPVYAQLETLFRLCILQKLLVEKNVYDAFGINMSFWLKNYSTRSFPVPDSLRTVYTYDERHERSTEYQWDMLVPMAGGVMIRPEIDKSDFRFDTTGMVDGLEKAVLIARPSLASLSWIFHLPLSVYELISGKN